MDAAFRDSATTERIVICDRFVSWAAVSTGAPGSREDCPQRACALDRPMWRASTHSLATSDSEPSSSSRCRVSMYVWGAADDEGPAVRELVETAQVEADDVAEATFKAELGRVPSSVDRLVSDVQGVDLQVARKASRRGPCRSVLVSVSVRGCRAVTCRG